MDKNSGSVDCARYSLVLFHVLFLVVGIFLLVLGIFILFVPGTKHAIYIATGDLTEDQIDNLCYVVLGVASVICVMALIGFLGTANNNKSLLLMVGIVMFVVLLLEVVLAIIAIVFQSQIHDSITREMTKSLAKYAGDNETDDYSVAWRETQLAFQCCGVDTSEGYLNHTNVFNNETGTPANGSNWYLKYGQFYGQKWPESCCSLDRYASVNNITACYLESALNKEGCLQQLGEFLSRHLILLSILAFLLVATQVGAMIVSCKMYKHVKNEKK